jgi:hypothetical protein
VAIAIKSTFSVLAILTISSAASPIPIAVRDLISEEFPPVSNCAVRPYAASSVPGFNWEELIDAEVANAPDYDYRNDHYEFTKTMMMVVAAVADKSTIIL